VTFRIRIGDMATKFCLGMQDGYDHYNMDIIQGQSDVELTRKPDVLKLAVI
jgi:hypothetical protein